MTEEKSTVESQANCIRCENLENCGTINRWLADYTKVELRKSVQKSSKNADCPNFTFLAISGTVLSDRMKNLESRSSEIKSRQKRKYGSNKNI